MLEQESLIVVSLQKLLATDSWQFKLCYKLEEYRKGVELPRSSVNYHQI